MTHLPSGFVFVCTEHVPTDHPCIQKIDKY